MCATCHGSGVVLIIISSSTAEAGMSPGGDGDVASGGGEFAYVFDEGPVLVVMSS